MNFIKNKYSKFISNEYHFSKWIFGSIIAGLISNISEFIIDPFRPAKDKDWMLMGMVVSIVLTALFIIIRGKIFVLPLYTKNIGKRIIYRTLFNSVFSFISVIIYTYIFNKFEMKTLSSVRS